MKRSALALSAALMIPLAACGGQSVEGNEAALDVDNVSGGNVESLPSDEAAAASGANAGAAAPDTLAAVSGNNAAAPVEGGEDEGQTPTIPASFHGRWGMVPGDCTSTRGDAKGLIIVSRDSIRYYEALAKPTRVTRSTETVFNAAFDVNGEGSEWKRTMALTRTGNRLTATDVYEGGGTLNYTRCS